MKKLNFSEVAAILFAAFFTVSFVAGCGDNQGGNQSENQGGNQNENQGGQGGGNQQGGGAKFANYKTVVSGLAINATDPKTGKSEIIGFADMKTHDGGFAHPGDTVVLTSEGKEVYYVSTRAFGSSGTYPACPNPSSNYTSGSVPLTSAVEQAKAEGKPVTINDAQYKEMDGLCK